MQLPHWLQRRRQTPYTVDPRLARDLQLLILAITVGTIGFTVNTGAAFTGFNQAMGFSDLFYGIIMGMPVFGAIMQIVAAYLLEHTRKRRKIFIIGGLVGRFMWIPLAIIPFIFPAAMQQARLWSVVLLLTIYQAFTAAVNVSFYSWMADLIPVEIRGRFFSRRSAISTVAGLLTGWFIGWFLDAFPGISSYSLLLIISGITGMADILFFFFINDPPMEVSTEKPPPPIQLVKEAFGNKQYIRLLIYAICWSFAVQFSAPFYNLYSLNTIHMSFMQLFLFGQLTANIFNILIIRKWGVALDRFGNKPILKLAGSICAFLPLLWIFTRTGQYWMVAIINIFAGLCWGAVDLGTQNLMFRLTPQKNRSMYVALYFLGVTTIGTAIANICGGWFLTLIEPLAERWAFSIWGWPLTKYHYLFILSSVLRYCALLGLAPRIQEPGAKPTREFIKSITPLARTAQKHHIPKNEMEP